MSDENNPNEEELLRRALGDLDNNPQVEAWILLHEMFQGMLQAGFSQSEASDLTAAYLIRVLKDGGSG